jgi:hypothetical protein
MSHFVLVFDPQKHSQNGCQSENVVDWGEYSNSQQTANLAAELYSRWAWNTPIYIEHRTERGGGSSGMVATILLSAKKDFSVKWGEDKSPIYDSGEWKKPPKWKGPEHKGLIFVGGFQKSHYSRMSKADFKKWTDLDKDSPQAQKLLQPIPIQYEMAHFGCRRNNQPKEHAKELLIRFLGPGASYDLNETKLRMFGAIDDNPYSTSRNSMKGAEPRPYLKIHTYEMTAEGKLTYESVDLLQACIDFYGTDDLMKMKEKNSWEIQKQAIAKYDKKAVAI